LNPDACSAIQQHGKSNLGILSIEMMSQYLHTVIMPQMIEKEEKEGNLNETEKNYKQYSTNMDLQYYVWVLFTNGSNSLALT